MPRPQKSAKGHGRAFGPLFAAALAKQRRGRHAEAAALYEQAIRADGSVAEAHNNRGCALLALGRLEEAVTALSAAVALRSDYADALDTLGVILAELGRHAEAVPYFERALAAAPAAGVAFHYGNALLALERFAQARAAFERALELQPAYAAAHNGIGAALARGGDEAGAVAAFEAANGAAEFGRVPEEKRKRR